MSVRNTSLETFAQMPADAGVRLPTTKALLDCSAATIWRLAAAGKLKTLKPSPRVTLFQVGSIRALLTPSN